MSVAYGCASGTAMSVAYGCASGTAMSVAYGCATLEMIQRIASYCGTKNYFSSIGTIK